MTGKSTLQWYEHKVKPLAERVYDGGYGSELLFKARSQSLEVNAHTDGMMVVLESAKCVELVCWGTWGECVSHNRV